MSKIKINGVHQLGPSDEGDIFSLPVISPRNEVGSFEECEELRAVRRLLDALANLKDGEALVIWKDFS